ncbi:MAG: MFS transporter, partial [Alphaproteobacteria bacterium]
MAGNSNDGLTPFRVYRPNGDIVPYEGAERRISARAPAAPTYMPASTIQPQAEQPAQSLLQPATLAIGEAQASGAPGPSVQQFMAAPAVGRRTGIPIGFMIFCGAAIALMSMGIRSILPLWQTPMLDELGWTSLQFSIALATQNLLWGAFSPIFGAIADKFGSEKVLTFGALLQVAGIWLMSQVSDPTMFFLSGGVMIGIAQSAAGMGIVLGAIGRLVEPRHRTMAFGLITSASSAGMIVMTPIGRSLLENNAWSDAFVMLSIIAVPMVLLTLFVRSNQNTGDLSTAAVAKLTIGEALGEALRHRGYVLLIFGFFVCGFHVTFIGVHLPKYLNDAGIGWQVAANALMIIGVFNVAACLAVGVIASTFSHK